nr:hypothetical protein [Roseovarius sp. Pro17]
MGQDEDAHALVRRADFCRTEQARRRRVAHVPKLSQHDFKAKADMTGDVLEEDPLGSALPDDAGDLWPQVAGIIGPAALASGAERLAGISGKDDIEGSAEGAGFETA